MYTENLKRTILEKLLEPSEFSKVIKYKINIQHLGEGMLGAQGASMYMSTYIHI
jgi:hypothetical protein